MADTDTHCATKTTKLTVAAFTNVRDSRRLAMFMVGARRPSIPPVPCRDPERSLLYLTYPG